MMRQRVLIAASVAILLIQNLSAAQSAQQSGETDMAYRTRLAQVRAAQVMAQAAAQTSPPPEIRIVALKHYPAHEMMRILQELSRGEGANVIVDENSNRLILQAKLDRIEELLNLVHELDVSSPSPAAAQSLTCRVYMVELLPKQSGLRSFRAELLDYDDRVSLPALVKAAEGREFVIDAFRADERDSSVEMEGRTASLGVFTEILREVLGEIPPDGIARMELDEKTPDLLVPAAQVHALPEPLRQHIHKLLGTEAQTVGYWFGTMSSPGEIRAPIGPWSIQLEVRTAQTNGLLIEVDVGEWRGDSTYSILSNSIQSKVGKSIIIGYNRQSAGARTMGAMVILLEADTSEAGGS